jgi:hypothetical protein
MDQLDRKDEEVDYKLLKETLETFVALNFVEPEIKSENNIYKWAG